MAAARWWRERRHAEEMRERHERVARHPLLPLEETSAPARGEAVVEMPSRPVKVPGVSSSGSAVERVSVATTDGVTDTRSTADQDRAA
jgi:hypothetical protein